VKDVNSFKFINRYYTCNLTHCFTG